MPKTTRHRDSLTWRRMFLGPLEYQIVESIWELQRCTVHDLARAIPESRAYTTVLTTADRLFHKGILDRKKAGQQFLYSARMKREELDIHFARQLLKRLLLLPASTRRTVVRALREGLAEGRAEGSWKPNDPN